MRFWYSVLVCVLAPFAFAKVLWQGLRDRRHWQGIGERFGFARASSGGLWVHAVSLGEVTAALPLIAAVRQRYPQLPVLLTTATLTGRARAQAALGAAAVGWLPYDMPGAMRRFLTRVRPRLAVIMETELWPNLFHQCRRCEVPVVLASARLSPRSVARYRRCGPLFRDVFEADVLVAAQTVEDAERFVAIGAPPGQTCVVGNVKFDVGVDAALTARGAELRSAHWQGRPVWIAGSTHEGEEDAVLTAHATLAAMLPGALLLLVPRHPERFQAVADLLSRRGFRFDRRSGANSVRADSTVLLVDSVGELAMLYAAADAAFVGGSLVPVGGHNLLEPAALGVPVLTGPSQWNAKDIAQLLLREGALLQVADAGELAEILNRLFADPAQRARLGASGRRVVEANRGTVRRLLDLFEPVLAGARR